MKVSVSWSWLVEWVGRLDRQDDDIGDDEEKNDGFCDTKLLVFLTFLA